MISILLTGRADLEERVCRLTGGSLSRCQEMTAEEDRQAADLKLNPADRHRSLTARAALRLTAATHSGRHPHEATQLAIRRRCRRCGGPHGRPQTDGMSLSSSSSSLYVLAGAAPPERDLGVDLEAIPESVFPGFDEYALHAAERFGPGQDGPGPNNRSRIEKWVLKEAVLKAAGVGLDHPPAQLLLGDAEVSTHLHGRDTLSVLRWRPVAESRDSSVEGLWCCLIPSPRGYAAAVAARAADDVRDLGA